MYKALDPGPLGISTSFRELCDLAQANGFEGVAVSSPAIEEAGGATPAKGMLEESGLRAANAGLPVEFRKDEATFQEGLAGLPEVAATLRAVGCTRVATWLMPFHPTLSSAENLALHAKRLRLVAEILTDQGIRLGLEYVGPATMRRGQPHEFVHDQKGLFELVDAIGRPGVGILLDAFHWYVSGARTQELAELNNQHIVLVHVNDAIAGVPADEQLDNARDLPGATGVIDLAQFMSALVSLGYDGPVVVEPFSQRLRSLDAHGAAAETARSLEHIWPQP